MQKQTFWEGRALRPGDTLEVDDATAKRWASYGIAWIEKPKSAKTQEVVQDISQTDETSHDAVPKEAAPSVAFESLPHSSLLVDAGITTLADIPRTLAALVEIDGIGTAKARAILEALNDN